MFLRLFSAFLGGGASLEFCMIPFNFLVKKAGYLNTGVWAKKAMKEAKLFGDVVEVASSADETIHIFQRTSMFLQTWIICTSLPITQFMVLNITKIWMYQFV